MRVLLLSVLAVLMVGMILIPNLSAQEVTIPSWIKNNAGWWATDQIDDSSFLQGIQYLVQKGIIVV